MRWIVLLFAVACSPAEERREPPAPPASPPGEQTGDDPPSADDDSTGHAQPGEGSSTGPGSSESSTSGADTGDVPVDLRLHHVQVKATHNSYHVAADVPLPTLGYTHAPLDVQLDELGVRQVELDVHYDAAGFEVHHLPIDTGTTCERLADCLSEIRSWSLLHPDHMMLSVWIEPKDDLDFEKIAGHYGELEAELAAIWPAEDVFTPSDLRGEHPTLREAVLAGAWPRVDDTRGMVAFVLLDGGSHRDDYLAEVGERTDRLMFVLAEPDEDEAAFVNFGDPIGDADAISAAVTLGFIGRARADTTGQPDAERAAAALDSGAHYVATDVPDAVDIPGGTPARCNPSTAPPGCTPERIESLAED